MRVLIAGSSGLIGTALKRRLLEKGDEAVALVRDKTEEGVYWDPAQKEINLESLEGFEAVVNLAGENIAEGRWTEAKKKKIRDSRVESTRFLTGSLEKLSHPPKVLVNASAIGFYGDRGAEKLVEESPPGSGFLSKVCCDWEAQAKRAPVRSATLRIGVVLSNKGGALKRMLLPFKLGLGGVIGSGKQYMSWIVLEDLVEALLFAIRNPEVNGAVNAVSPSPVTNRQFTKALGKVLGRPTFFPMPAFAVKLIFGEMGEELLLGSSRVLPKQLEALGFKFRHPHIEEALRSILNS